MGRRAAAVLGVAGVLVVAATACGSRLDRERVAADANVDLVDGGGGPGTTGSANPASDVGVTPTTITIGLIVSKTSPLGQETFSGPMYGVQAYVQALNARGGINGRTVVLKICDDAATGAGNRRCVRSLVDDEKVFAFVGNTILNYAGASYVNDRGVPDIGGEPISNAYEQYRHIYNVLGSDSPRDGKIGFDGVLTTTTEPYRWLKENVGATTAGVVAFNQSDSLRYANLIESSLRAEGYTVVREQVDFAVPNFEAAAIDMRRRGVDIVFDAMDVSGNVALCKAMETIGFTVKAKVTSAQSWTEAVRQDFASTPRCRNTLYATGRSRNYMDTQYPMVARFRDEFRAAFPDREDRLSMWTLEGWGAMHWFTEAADSCGAQLTRVCVEAFLVRPEGYDAGGLFDRRTFRVTPPETDDGESCVSVARWQDDAYEGRGGWVSQTPNGEFACYTGLPNITYRP